MKKLQMSNEHKALVESVIRQNPQFEGNEDLLDVFVEAVYKKSYLLIDAIKDMERLKRHLVTITQSYLEQILKERQKFYSISKKDNIISVKKTAEKKQEEKVVSLKKELEEQQEALIDPLDYFPKQEASEGTVDELVQKVRKISLQYPKKKYWDIFSLRYIKGFDQTQIAYDMKISQVELSKRFAELIKLTKEN